MLSLLECAPSPGPVGGDFVMPLDWTPPSPRPSDPPSRRFGCFFGRCLCWKLMRPLAGDPPSDQGAGCKPRDVVALAWGVVMYVSSISSSMRSSSELDDESDGTIPGALPNEPERLIFSWLPIADQSELDDCSVLLKSPLRRPGIFMPRPPIVGLESELGWSARVEWCRLVAAREKSSPLERRGRTFVGEAKTCEWSSLGLSGPTRLLGCGLPTDDWAGE